MSSYMIASIENSTNNCNMYLKTKTNKPTLRKMLSNDLKPVGVDSRQLGLRDASIRGLSGVGRVRRGQAMLFNLTNSKREK